MQCRLAAGYGGMARDYSIWGELNVYNGSEREIERVNWGELFITVLFLHEYFDNQKWKGYWIWDLYNFLHSILLPRQLLSLGGGEQVNGLMEFIWDLWRFVVGPVPKAPRTQAEAMRIRMVDIWGKQNFI